MDDRLHGLSKIPGREEQGLYLQELREQCALLEAQLWQEAENGSPRLQNLLEGYIAARDELEFQSVRQALGFGRSQTH